jgi:hypothetical protein
VWVGEVSGRVVRVWCCEAVVMLRHPCPGFFAVFGFFMVKSVMSDAVVVSIQWA